MRIFFFLIEVVRFAVAVSPSIPTTSPLPDAMERMQALVIVCAIPLFPFFYGKGEILLP